MWSDGSTPQTTNPNVFWSCPTDFMGDGTHPSTVGAQKVGSLLLNFFTSDSTSTPWFLGNGCNLTAISETSEEDPSQIKIFPNPANGSVGIQSGLSNIQSVNIFNSNGERVYSLSSIDSDLKNIHIPVLSAGVYLVHMGTKDGLQYRKKLVLTH